MMHSPEHPGPTRTRWPTHHVWLGLALLVALAYLFDLGGNHIPSFGDEMVYANIARLTAATGHWLPLQSAWEFMRNTKPPLLFWQAMVSGGWGEHWTLFHLRLPSVLYTWGTALMVAALSWKITRQQSAAQPDCAAQAAPVQHPAQALTVGAIAALIYLSFFSTYRYGRPYLTSAAESFWLFGVLFALAWSPTALLASRWKFPLLAGLAIGMACLYKSFVMVVPIGFALALIHQWVGARKAPWLLWRAGVFGDGLKVLVSSLLALAVFGLWFALDPQPGEVWREFVVGENAGKLNSSRGYWARALSGNSGLLAIALGYFSNAHLLLPIAVGCCFAAWRSWRARRVNGTTVLPLSDAEKILWVMLLAFALVFALPTQRSTRYLIPAMPALAVLMAVYWQRIGRLWFVLSLLLCLLFTLAMGLIAVGAVRATGNATVLPFLFWVYLLLLCAACVAGMLKKAWCRPVAALSTFAVLMSLAWVSHPFNGDLGRFKPHTLALLQGQTVQVPNSFNGHFERYTFIIPGAHLVPYFSTQPADHADADVDALLKTQRYALVQRRVGDKPCSRCRIIDERWDLRSRRKDSEGLMSALRSPETYWYAKEYLVEAASPAPAQAARP